MDLREVCYPTYTGVPSPRGHPHRACWTPKIQWSFLGTIAVPQAPRPFRGPWMGPRPGDAEEYCFLRKEPGPWGLRGTRAAHSDRVRHPEDARPRHPAPSLHSFVFSKNCHLWIPARAAAPWTGPALRRAPRPRVPEGPRRSPGHRGDEGCTPRHSFSPSPNRAPLTKYPRGLARPPLRSPQSCRRA